MAQENLTRLNTDLLSQILARLDGPALASAASASSDLRAVVEEDDLWKHLSHATWPSTQDTSAQNLISSLGGFSNFYARSFPFILYNPPKKLPSLFQESTVPKTPLSPSDVASFVDVHFRGKCIFSKVLYGIQGADAVSGGDRWFLDCPFRLDLLQCSRDIDCHDYVDCYEDDEMGMIAPSVDKNGRGVEKLCKELEEEVRLSWVLLDTRSGKAVNLSSQKPVLVQRQWASKDDILMRFGCVVPPEDGEESTECVISARVQFDRGEGCLKLREINMQLEDKDGVHISGRRSLMVLEKASRCCRSRKWSEFDKGYGEYVREKREMREKKMKSEGVVDKLLCAFTGTAVFAALCYFYILSVW